MNALPVVLATLAAALPASSFAASAFTQCSVDSLRMKSSPGFVNGLAPEKAMRNAQGAPDVQKDATAAATMKLTFSATSAASADSTVKEFTQCAQTKLREAFKAEKSAFKGKAVEFVSGCDRVNHTIQMKNGDVLYGELCGITFSTLGDLLEDTLTVNAVTFDVTGQTAEILLTVEVETPTYRGRFVSGSAKPQERPVIVDGRDIAAVR